MRRRTLALSIFSVLGAAALAGCSGGSGGYGGNGAASSTPKETQSAAAGGGMASDADLSTAQTSLGTVVVTKDGMTAYYFDKDTKDSGVSACTGTCLTMWPPITTAEATPTVDGVTAEVGTIPTPDGKMQITIDGRPIYTYAQDTAPGDVNGQDVSEVWYVIAPDGTEVTEAASSSTDSSGY